MNRTTEAFIRAHRDDDVRQLVFQGARYPDVDLPYALDQIAGWQRACKKLPSWAAVDGLRYPPHLSMEQCSSESTGAYKRSVLQRLTASWRDGALYDLTGGFGVDFSFLAPLFPTAVYVERQASLCELARHNFPLLGLRHADVLCAEGEAVLEEIPEATESSPVVLFLDPARRDSHGGKTVLLEDCTPDVTRLRDGLLRKATLVMLKLSPMLDWHAAVAALSAPVSGSVCEETSGDVCGGVCEVHIVSVGNECKELLLVLSRGFRGAPTVYCVNDGDSFIWQPGMETVSVIANAEIMRRDPPFFLYEPNSSIRKAGCFDAVSARFGVFPLGANSHLFVSTRLVPAFPGRRFVVETVTTMNKKQLKSALQGITQANITVRNFPMTVKELRRKLKLRDGGDTYLFATTVGDREHRLFICKKLN